MVQIVEWNPDKGYEFGAGQVIETAMASIVGLKTFRIQVPRTDWADAAVERLAVEVKLWIDKGKKDLAVTDLRADGDRRWRVLHDSDQKALEREEEEKREQKNAATQTAKAADSQRKASDAHETLSSAVARVSAVSV
jgi:hypothetical protein